MAINIQKLRCGNCGYRKIELKNAKGRYFVWKTYNKIKLLVDCELPICGNCDEIIFRIWSKDSKKLDIALSKSEEFYND